MPEGTQQSESQVPQSSFLRLFVKEIRKRAQGTQPWRDYEPNLRAVHRQQHPLAEVAGAARTALGMDPSDSQILASLAMIDRRAAQLGPGEGKTLAVAMAAAFHALRGKKVHIFRRDDILALHDASWMLPLFAELGVTTGCVAGGMNRKRRRDMRSRSVVYTTPAEAAMDYLEESAADDGAAAAIQQTELIADDIEWTLVASASRQAGFWTGDRPPQVLANRVGELAAMLEENLDYEDAGGVVHLTHRGVHRMETGLMCSLQDESSLPVLAMVGEALREIAARKSAGSGLLRAHDTANASNVIDFRGRVLNAITVRSLVAAYSGVTGIGSTAAAEASELLDLYKLGVVEIPLASSGSTVEGPDEVFGTASARNRALARVADVEHAGGRPILIAAISIPQASVLSELLDSLGIDHEVVSGVHPEKAADLISRAGQKGAVTILTPHAPIGIDIPLGDEVASLGGLLVLLASRSRHRRMDEYYRGLTARRGHPGEARYFVSFEDDLAAEFNLNLLLADSRSVARPLEDVQWVVQMESLALTKALAKFEDFVEQQRRVMLSLREAVVRGEATSLLKRLDEQRLRKLSARYGERHLLELEKRARLDRIDDAWAEYLAWVSDYAQARWLSAGGLDPLRDFQIEAERTFHSLRRGMEDEVVTFFAQDELPEEPPASFDRAEVRRFQLPEPVWARTRERVAAAVEDRLKALGALEA